MFIVIQICVFFVFVPAKKIVYDFCKVEIFFGHCYFVLIPAIFVSC